MGEYFYKAIVERLRMEIRETRRALSRCLKHDATYYVLKCEAERLESILRGEDYFSYNEIDKKFRD